MIKVLITGCLAILINLPTTQAQKVIRKGVKPATRTAPSRTEFYTIDQLRGKWQETRRKKMDSNEPVAFSDTLMLNFNKRDSVYVYDGISMSQKGLAAIDGPASLSLAGDTYTIVSMNKNNLILNDGEFVRSFKKTHLFYHETFGNLKADAESFEKPKAIHPDKLNGRWDVYRRQANPGATEAMLIKSITFNAAAKDSVSGSISIYSSGNTKTENFTGYISGTSLYIMAPGFNGTWATYKADGKEFVFGKENEIIYYAKKF
jgi:hypothetical protein